MRAPPTSSGVPAAGQARATRRIGTSDPVAPEIARRGARVAKGRDRPQAAVIGKKRGFRARTPGGWRGRHAPATLTLAVALGFGGPDVSETHFASEGGRVWFGATRKGRRRAQPRRRRAGGITGRRPRREGIEIGYGFSRRAFGTPNPRVKRAASFFFQACSNPSETDAARCSSTLPTPFARSGSSLPSLRGAPRGRRARSPRARSPRAVSYTHLTLPTILLV